MREEPRQVRDVETLKVLAHPLRRRILQMLRQHGPATATTLGRALGENSGATSYHLRLLARHGLIAEAPDLAHGRERWWRTRSVDLRFPPRSEQSDEFRELFAEFNRLMAAADDELVAQYETERDQLGEWADAAWFSRASIRCTLPEVREFYEEYLRLVNRYSRPPEEAPEGARRMLLRFAAFPAPVGKPDALSTEPDGEDT